MSFTKINDNHKYLPHILYVDDEQDNLDVFELSFENDFIVHTTKSANKALKLLESKNINIILSDLNMPEMLGSAFLKKVFENNPETIRILTSTDLLDISKINAVHGECIHAFVPKPWHLNQLKTVLKNAFENSQLSFQAA